MSGLGSGYTIDHFGITVPDLDQAVAFFVDGIGFEELYREGPFSDPEGGSFERTLDVDRKASLRAAMLRYGSTSTVELLEYSGLEATGEPPVNSRHSAGHLALRVKDMDLAVASLEQIEGVRLLEGPTTIDDGPSAGVRWIYFRAPWGLQLELCELPAAMAAELERT